MKDYLQVKKYCSFVILIIFSMTLFGCGGGQSDKSASVSVEKKKEIVASEQIVDAKLYDKVVQVGNKVITLPTKYADFVEADAILVSKDLSDEYIMDANSSKICEMSIGDTIFQLYLENNSEQSNSLKNADVKYINSTKGKDVFYSGGIHVGSTLDELTEKWGQPSLDASQSYNDVMKYCYYEYPVNPKRINPMWNDPKLMSTTGNEYTITIDRKTATITDIQYKWDNIPNDDILRSFSYSFDNDKNTISYKIPSYLVEINKFGSIQVSTCLIDGTPYVVIIDGNMSKFPNEKEITNENIISNINVEFASKKYDVQILNKTDNEGYACGYIRTDNLLECVSLYMNKENSYRSYTSKIFPLDEKGILTDSAVSKFKGIMSDFAQSIHESKAQ